MDLEELVEKKFIDEEKKKREYRLNDEIDKMSILIYSKGGEKDSLKR